MNLRKYGSEPYNVAVIHGGPGAPGEMADVAEELSKSTGVLEPLQTKDSIDGQVEELKTIIIQNTKEPITLIGWSWGAWLSFILAARYPLLVKKLILVSSGPFEVKYTRDIRKTRLSHLDEKNRARMMEIEQQLFAPTPELFQEFGALYDKADSFSPLDKNKEDDLKTQPEIYTKVWPEASRLRMSGELLALGKDITCPVVAIHGDYDPHPAEGVKEPLSKIVKDFKFVLLEKCGHHPWLERHARDEFYNVLKAEL
ncbi:MAG: alpha/beta hydrolase [Nanoarchaeota archaeon]|nr:alpha/beta hydrolase [Nanoarchaeota archaeon]